jgi:hypothetical protein
MCKNELIFLYSGLPSLTIGLLPGRPDLKNFRFSWVFFLWVVFLSITDGAWHTFGLLFPHTDFEKNGLGYILGGFLQNHLVTLLTAWIT